MLLLGFVHHSPRYPSNCYDLLLRGLNVVHNVLRRHLRKAAQCFFDGSFVCGHVISGHGSACHPSLSFSQGIFLPLMSMRFDTQIIHSQILVSFACSNSSAVMCLHAAKFSIVESSLILWRNGCQDFSMSMRPSSAQRRSRRWGMSP